MEEKNNEKENNENEAKKEELNISNLSNKYIDTPIKNNENNLEKENNKDEFKKEIKEGEAINEKNNIDINNKKILDHKPKSEIELLLNQLDEIKKEKSILEEKNRELEEKNNKLNEENICLNNKLKKLKDSVLQLKERLEKDIYIKLENKTQSLKEQILQNENLNKEIKTLKEEIEKLKTI